MCLKRSSKICLWSARVGMFFCAYPCLSVADSGEPWPMHVSTLRSAVAGIVGALTLSAPDAVLLTVRQADGYATPGDVVAASVSADGRYVAFASFARLVPADTNQRRDIYVLDRVSGTVTLESLASDGSAREHDSLWPRI